jgi:hypothetical protein
MEYEKLIGRIAADKDSRKLGKIVKIEKIQDRKTKILKPHVLIKVRKIFRQDIIVVVDATKILKSDDFHVWFDITKDEFETEVRETRALMYLYSD